MITCGKSAVRKLVYESDFSEEDALRMENSGDGHRSGSADGHQARASATLSSSSLDKLSQEDRNLLLLKEVEGHSVEELSRMTNMNENTIKVKLFRARQKLVQGGSTHHPRNRASQRLMDGVGRKQGIFNRT